MKIKKNSGVLAKHQQLKIVMVPPVKPNPHPTHALPSPTSNGIEFMSSSKVSSPFH
jgi:hypothetical protein